MALGLTADLPTADTSEGGAEGAAAVLEPVPDTSSLSSGAAAGPSGADPSLQQPEHSMSSAAQASEAVQESEAGKAAQASEAVQENEAGKAEAAQDDTSDAAGATPDFGGTQGGRALAY